MKYIREETNFEKTAHKEGFRRFNSIYGQYGWEKDGKFYTWCGNCNPNAAGYAAQNLQESTPPKDFHTTHNYNIRNNNGKIIGTILWAGGCIVGFTLTVATGILVFSNPTSAIGVGLLAALLLKQQKAEAKEVFIQANAAGTPGADPILVDLNGDGVKTTTLENGVYFDHEVDGFAESSAWVSEEDGILVIDKNGNGVIDNGSEVFGDNYVKGDGSKAVSGFDALADLDSNNDGVINANDEAFSQIKILKGDGELISLEEAGITSINLNSTESNTTDENGNTLVSSSTFTKSDGTTGSLGDFNLIVNKMDSFAVNWVNESEEVSKLPDILGCGTLHTLHQAMMRDKNGNGNLKKLVEDFIAAESEENKKKILGQILYRWTGADKVLVSDGGNHYDGQKLWVIEKFIGEEFKGVDNNGHPNIWAAPFLDDAYNHIANYVYYRLMVQCDDRIKGLFELIELEYDFDDNKVRYNFDKVIGYVDSVLSEDEARGRSCLNKVCDFDYYLNGNKKWGLRVA